MKNDNDRILTGFSCFDEVSGGLPIGKLTWIWGALPLIEENLWFGLSLALESASKYSTRIVIICFQTDPVILKDCVAFVYPGLTQKLQIVGANCLNPDSEQSVVCLIDARNSDDEGLRHLMRNLSAGFNPAIVVMESIAATNKTTGSFNHELFAHLEEHAATNKSGIIVIPFGSTYALRQFVGQNPTVEAFRKELYCHRPAGEHSGLNIFVVPEGELRSPVAGYERLGTVRLDVDKTDGKGIEFVFMRYLRKETREAELTGVDPWGGFQLRNIVKFECGKFEIVWKD